MAPRAPYLPVLPSNSKGFLSWSRLWGPWGRRAKASSEHGESGEGSRQGQIFFTSHMPGTVLET